MNGALELRGVALDLDGRRLLGPLDVTVAPGEVVTLMGPSGCGKSSLLSFLCGVLAPAFTAAGEVFESARQAAPPSIADGATYALMPSEPGAAMTTVHEGTNGWTCFPDNPGTPAPDPACMDATAMQWVGAYMGGEVPAIPTVGFVYHLQGGWPASNTDPTATGPTEDNEWLPWTGPHVAIMVPDVSILDGMSTDPHNGGPWVMWSGTSYAHIMVPVPRFDP